MRKATLALIATLIASVPSAFAAEKKSESYRVPYRMTNAQHVLIRAKLNGKGPYNFILDTGAPALFVATKVAKDLGVDAEDKWGTFDTVEIEGGVVFKKARGRIEDPFQLKGMNNMGLAGMELHGVIGYNLLAQYRMTFDFTKTKMVWTKLDWTPQAPMGLGKKLPKGQGGFDMGNLMKMVSQMFGKRTPPEKLFQGYLGIEVESKDDNVIVTNVVQGSPADKAGLKVGDRIDSMNESGIENLKDLQRLIKKIAVGKEVTFSVTRQGKDVEITLTAGKGL